MYREINLLHKYWLYNGGKYNINDKVNINIKINVMKT